MNSQESLYDRADLPESAHSKSAKRSGQLGKRYRALSEANSAFLLVVLVILLIVLAVSSIARRCCGYAVLPR
jgi:hypothetical protein